MTFNKVYQLSEKLLIKTAQFNKKELYVAERERLATFFNQMSTRFTQILNEMEGDLMTLRIKKFPKQEWREFLKMYYQLIQLNKTLPEYRPYDAANKVIRFINERSFRAQVLSLNLNIQDFLEHNQVDWGKPLQELQQASVNSLNKLFAFAEELYTYMVQNPLTEDLSAHPSIDARIIPDPNFKEVGPEEVTKVEVKK